MVFEECLMTLTMNKKQLHLKTNSLMDLVKEVAFVQKIILFFNASFFQKYNQFASIPFQETFDQI